MFLAGRLAPKGVAKSTEMGYYFWHDENSCSDALSTVSDVLSRLPFPEILLEI
jgi:hypothetical protein